MAKTDRDRGPIGAWMRRERKARGWKDVDVARELAQRGVPLQPASYRGYEAGPQRPSPEVIRALSAVFGSAAPEPDTEIEATEPVQLSGLIKALEAQTAAMRDLVEVMRLRESTKGSESPEVQRAAELLLELLRDTLPPPTEVAHEEDGSPDPAGQEQPGQ